MKPQGPLGHIRRIAKRIKKRNYHMTLMEVQHDLAQYLGFKNWGDLIKCPGDKLQLHIDRTDLEGL